MNIVFDLDKSQTNFEKHEVELAKASAIDWETLLAVEDTRFEYGEVRMIGYAYIELRLYCVVFTDRDNERRIISLRKANSREVKRYAKT